MSLKDAIREAVDERHKQETTLNDLAPVNEPQVTTLEGDSTTGISRVGRSASATKQIQNAKPANSKAAKIEQDFKYESVETAAMTVRVSRRHRVHWLVSAKKEGTSLTAAITEALNARYGEPSE